MNEIIDSFEELASLIASDYNANGPKSLYNRLGTITDLRGFFGHIKRSKSSPVRSPATLSHAGQGSGRCNDHQEFATLGWMITLHRETLRA